MQNKSALRFLLIIFLINLIFRYPRLPHESGVDSFENHALVVALINHGSDLRITNFLAYFGLYPNSSPTGGLFLLATFTQITGLSVELSILLLMLSLCGFSIISTFILGKEIHRDNMLGLFLASIYPLTRTILGFTSWTYSYRGPLIVSLPFFLFLLLKISKTSKSRLRYFSLFTILFFCLVSVHRMAFFLIFIIIASILSHSVINYRPILDRFNYSKYRAPIIFIIFVIIYALSFSGYLWYGESTREIAFKEGENIFFNSSNIFLDLINITLLYSMSFGILLMFAPLGFFNLINKKRMNFFDIKLIFVFGFFSLFWLDIIYSRTFFTLFITFLVANNLYYFHKKLENMSFLSSPVSSLAVLCVIMLCNILPIFITVNNESPPIINSDELTDETFNLGLYLKIHNFDNTLSNDDSINSKLEATSEKPSAFKKHADPLESDLNNFEDLMSGDEDFLWDYSNKYSTVKYSILRSNQQIDSPIIHTSLRYWYGTDSKHYNLVITEKLQNQIYIDNEFEISPFISKSQNQLYVTYRDSDNSVYMLNYI